MKKLYILSLSLLFAQSIKSSDTQELALVTKAPYPLLPQPSSTLQVAKLEDKTRKVEEAEKVEKAEETVLQYAQSSSKKPQERINATEAALFILAKQIEDHRLQGKLSEIAQKHMLQVQQQFPSLFHSFQQNHAEVFNNLKKSLKIFIQHLKKDSDCIITKKPSALKGYELKITPYSLRGEFTEFLSYQTQSNIRNEQMQTITSGTDTFATPPLMDYSTQLKKYMQEQDEKRKKFSDATTQALKLIHDEHALLQGKPLLKCALYTLYSSTPTADWFTNSHLQRSRDISAALSDAWEDDEYEIPEDIHTLTTQIIKQ